MNDLLEIPGFLDASESAAIRDELAREAGSAATVLSGGVSASVRRTTRIACPAPVADEMRERMMHVRPELEAHFGVTLADCEAPQFLRYETGDFFVPHQDGNTPLVYDDSRFRRISAVVFLSEPSLVERAGTYGGGALVFHGSYQAPGDPVSVNPPAGTLVAFRSEVTHEVTPVTHGERYSIVTWFHA